MAQAPDIMQQIPPQHQAIVNDTWSQLLGAEGGSTQNLAVDLLKNLVSSLGQNVGQQSGEGGAPQGGGDFLSGLSGLAGHFLGGGQREKPQESNSGEAAPQSTNAPSQDGSDYSGSRGGGNNDIWEQLGTAAGQFLGTRKDGGSGTPNTATQSSGGGSFLDQLGGVVEKSGFLNKLGSGGGENLLGALGGIGSLAALAGSLRDPSSLLQFFLKSPVAQQAANPDNSSRDIYKVIKNAIFGLLGSKLPTEEFQKNPDAKTAWKGYLGLIANALRRLA